MRQLKRHVENLRRPHLGPGKRRNIIAMALAVAVVGLSVYFLLGSGTPSATTTADSDGSGGQVVQSGSSGVRHTCAHPTIVPMDRENAQSGVTKGKYYVTNDTWNARQLRWLVAEALRLQLQQLVRDCHHEQWYRRLRRQTSPNVQETWYPTPTKLSSWKSITSQFSDIPPGIGSNYGIWEFEYDVWLNGLADSGSTEVMIWTYNNGQTPLGSPSGSFTDGGRTYEVYHSSPPRQYIAFVDRSNNLSGRVNLLDFFNYVISKGWMPRSSTLYQICHGVELVSTNSRSEKFTINNFSINMATHS